MAQAQGFGPDPFKPFNSQYLQYVYPIAPETGPAATAGRNVGSRDNQFQNWVNEQEGAARLSSERYGAGVPYWRVRTDRKEEQRIRLNRRNARNDDVLGSITQKYLAYFSEESPSKRAILLRENASGRNLDNVSGAARPGNGDDSEEGPLPRGASRRSGASSAGRASSGMGDEKSGRRIPPAPEIRGTLRGSSRTPRRPSDVLDRARRLEDDTPDSDRPATRKRARRTLPDPPPLDE
jgi:hypothetical protein